MSTLDNLANLPEHFVDVVVKPLEGTRLYDQEVLGHLIGISLGALWSDELCASMLRHEHWPTTIAGGIVRTVIAVDPSIGAGLADECGIIVASLCADGRVYIRADLSKRCGAPEWCRIIAHAFRAYNADAVVAEINQGGELVRHNLEIHAPELPLIEVWAKKGKKARAEPVHLASEQRRVRFAGQAAQFAKLVHQLCNWDPETDDESPDRLDAMVYAVLELIPIEGIGDLISVVRRNRRR